MKKLSCRKERTPLPVFFQAVPRGSTTLGRARIATFVAINLCGPEIHSMYRWRKQQLVHLDGGFEESNFKVLGKLYSEAMSNLGINHMPVLAAEDEMAILGQISYSESTDELLGFCGVSGEDHKCLDSFTVVVGNGIQGYNTIVNAFNEYKIAPFSRAIILNICTQNYLGFLFSSCLRVTGSTTNLYSGSGRQLNVFTSRNFRKLLAP